jgi:peptidase E
MRNPSSEANLLLTSAGPTTNAMQERLLKMAQVSGNKTSRLTVLRLSDGWLPFGSREGVSFTRRGGQRGENLAARAWSNHYVKHVLTGAEVVTHRIGGYDPISAQRILNEADLLLVPGGNTFQTIRGMNKYGEMITNAVNNGLPYMGESAGTIIAGRTTGPASLEPADIKPLAPLGPIDRGLRLIDADVVVHTFGAREFDIHTKFASVTSRILSGYTTKIRDSLDYAHIDNAMNSTYILNDTQALSVVGGEISRI